MREINAMSWQLLKSQKDDTFTFISKQGLNPLDFVWDEIKSQDDPKTIVSRLIYKPQNYYFIFDFFSNLYGTKRSSFFSPGREVLVERMMSDDWGEQLFTYVQWLNNIKRETETPDFWSEISKQKKLFETASSNNPNNEMFTAKEQKHITQQLKEIKTYIIDSAKLSKEQIENANKRFDYLEAALKRLGRFDYVNIFMSTIMNLIIVAGINSQIAGDIYKFIQDHLIAVFTTIIQLNQ